MPCSRAHACSHPRRLRKWCERIWRCPGCGAFWTVAMWAGYDSHGYSWEYLGVPIFQEEPEP